MDMKIKVEELRVGDRIRLFGRSLEVIQIEDFQVPGYRVIRYFNTDGIPVAMVRKDQDTFAVNRKATQ